MLESKGFSIIELIVSLFLISVVTSISYMYLSSHLKVISMAKGYVNQEEVSHFIEQFFRKDTQCLATLRKAESDNGIYGGELTIDKLISVKADGTQQTASFFSGLKNKLVGDIEVSFFPLKNNREIAQLDYTIRKTDKKTGQLQAKKKSFYVDILRNNRGEIEACLGSSTPFSEYCKGGQEHMLIYDESSLNPVLSSLIEEAQPHGATWTTLTKNTFSSALGVSCLSYTVCNRGEWNNSIYCYNSCTDEVWSNGDSDDYRSLDDDKNCAGNNSRNRFLEKCDERKQFVCGRTTLALPSCSIDLNDFCHHDKNSVPPINSYSSLQIKNICESGSLNVSSSSSPIILPRGNYGDTTPIIRKIVRNNLTFGYVSTYARCEYSGQWQIMGVTCDEDPKVRPHGRPQNIWGRTELGAVCQPKYPPSKFSCRTSQTITLYPNISSDSLGPIPPETRSIKDIYKDQIDDYVAHGAPLRFTFNFKGRDSVSYTASCNAKTGRFKVLTQSPYCQARNRKLELDLIFVIDNSESMAEEQNNLAVNLDRFLNEFLNNDIKFHIAVTTTDSTNRLAGGFICNYGRCKGRKIRQIERVKDLLKTAIRAGIEGSWVERPFQSVLDLKRTHPEFFRKKAHLALFILTDEEEDSQFSEDDFINFLFSSSSRTYHLLEGRTASHNTRSISVSVSGLDRKKENTIAFIAVNDGSSASRFGHTCFNIMSRWGGYSYSVCPTCDNSHGENNEKLRSFMAKMDMMMDEDLVPPPGIYRSDNEVDLCNPDFADAIEILGDKLSALLQTVAPPVRPASLDILDQSSWPEALKDGLGALKTHCP